MSQLPDHFPPTPYLLGRIPQTTNDLNDHYQIDLQNGSRLLFTPVLNLLTNFSLKREFLKKITLAQRSFTNANFAATIGSVGLTEFEAAYEAFSQLVTLAVAAKSECIYFLALPSLLEAKAAVLAAKEQSELPVLVTFALMDQNTLADGSDLLAALVTLEGLA